MNIQLQKPHLRNSHGIGSYRKSVDSQTQNISIRSLKKAGLVHLYFTQVTELDKEVKTCWFSGLTPD